MTNLPRPRAILFDWDNTLVDTWPVIHEALHKTFVEAGHEPWTLEMVKQKVARSMRDYFPELFGSKWQEVGQRYRDHYGAIRLERLKEREGAALMLAALKTKPLYLAVVSNKEGKNLRIESTHLGWDKYFGKLIGATDTPRDKPAADPIYAALAGSKIEPGPDVWFIGDSDIDMECALATGCTAVFYGELPEKPLKYPFAAHVKNHSELLELLDYILK